MLLQLNLNAVQAPAFPSCLLLNIQIRCYGLMIDVSALNTLKCNLGRLTWVRQDGVCLWQKLVTANSLVAFSTPGGEK